MNALARHDVGQGDARGQHSHPNFTPLRLGALFFNHPKCIGSTVVSDNDARVFHEPLSPLPSARASRRNRVHVTHRPLARRTQSAC